MALNSTPPDPSGPPASGTPSTGTGAVPAPETPPEAAAPAAEESQTLDQFEAATSTRTDESGRDDKGRFIRPRHRAVSQQARSEDVPRIAELTRRLRDAEAERDRLKGGVASPPPVASVPTPPVEPSRPAGSVPPTAAPSPYPPVAAAADDPEPDPEKYSGDGSLTKWMRDHARWSAREELRAARAEYEQRQAEAQRAAKSAQLTSDWEASKAIARTKYPDFEKVALLAPTIIPEESMIDLWIVEESDADVLYHLQKHPDEVRAILAMPKRLDQIKALTLLQQRLIGPPTRTAAGTTGAVPAQQPVQPVARPPTPVRTGPMRTGEEPSADLDTLSLSAFAKATNGGRQRRA